METWIIIGPLAVAAVGWFIGSEIHNLRKRFDRIEQTQTQMAITLGKLEEKVKWWWPVRAIAGGEILVKRRGAACSSPFFLYISPV